MGRVRRARTEAREAAQILREYKDRIERMEDEESEDGVQKNKNIFDYVNCTDRIEWEEDGYGSGGYGQAGYGQ